MTKKTMALLLSILLGSFGLSAWGQNKKPTLWITDDYNRTAYEVGLDGVLRSSFVVEIMDPFPGGFQFSISPSEITVDSLTDTLWIVAENPGRIVNFSKTGSQLSPPILGADFGAIGPEGVAYDPDDSLWIVDDPESQDPKVFHIKKNGDLIASFPTTSFDPQSTSPQGIAVDAAGDTLWIVDNVADRVYNVTRFGDLIKMFDSPGANPQGIDVDEWDGTLWITDRGAQTIYHLTADGVVLSSFPSATYDPSSMNPTGVAFDNPAINARGAIERIRGDLQMLLDSGTCGEKDDERVSKAIEKLNKAISAKNLTATGDLDPENGKKVFEESEKAVDDELKKIVNDGRACASGAQHAIDRLVEVMRSLAQMAVDRAQAACDAERDRKRQADCQKKVDEANEKFAKVQSELDKGHFDHAIKKCKEAWEKAQDALEKLQ